MGQLLAVGSEARLNSKEVTVVNFTATMLSSVPPMCLTLVGQPSFNSKHSVLDFDFQLALSSCQCVHIYSNKLSFILTLERLRRTFWFGQASLSDNINIYISIKICGWLILFFGWSAHLKYTKFTYVRSDLRGVQIFFPFLSFLLRSSWIGVNYWRVICIVFVGVELNITCSLV